MTRDEIKTELERIHGTTGKPDDWTFNQWTDSIWYLASMDATKAEEIRGTLADISSDLGVDGIYRANRDVTLHFYPEPEPEPEG